MALSFVQYTGDGSTVTFAVPFPYIAQSHIQVKVDGVLKTASTDYTFPTSSTIQFTTAPLSGLIVEIRRVTPRTERLVDFQDASTLTEATLDQDSNQNFFVAQEAFDLADSNIKLAPDNTFDAEGLRIKNLADPSADQDATPKKWVDAFVATQGLTGASGIVSTDTIAALREIAIPSSTVSVNVRGYYTPGDGGGGQFYWAAESTAADNGGTVILPTGYAGTGRWLRNYSGAVNVRWFGAKGDGVSNSTAAFQAAAVAANGGVSVGAGPGGAVLVPNGSYRVNPIGIRSTVLTGESMAGTIIKPFATYVSGQQYLFDAALDRDGVTINTDGGGGGVRNLSLVGESKGWHALRTYGGHGVAADLMVSGFVDGVSFGLPIWMTPSNIYAFGNSGRGFFTYSGPNDNGTSCTFMDCWADANGGDGFQITQLYYSSFINCSSQANTGKNWNFDGATNGLTANYSLSCINCGSEGGAGVPFYIRKQREFTLISPRIISPAATVDFVVCDDVTGTIIDYSAEPAPGAGKYKLTAINSTAGIGSIRVVGGDVTTDAASEPYLSTIATSINGVQESKLKRLRWNDATAAQRHYAEVADVDGYSGLNIYGDDGKRLMALRRIGTPIFSTNGAIGTPATYLKLGDVSFYVDDAAAALKFVVKDGAGTVKTGSVTLA